MSSPKISEPLCAIRMPQGQTLAQAHKVEIVDQLLLPHSVRWETVSTAEEAWQAIKSMKIRGAPAIASLASLGIACELLRLLSSSSPTENISSVPSLQKYVQSLCDHLLTSRPTAVNLREALDRISTASQDVSGNENDPRGLAGKIVRVAEKVWSEDVERNHRIGDLGAEWLLEKLEREGTIEKGEKINVLTVCNTGSLATSGYGTALGMITSLHNLGRLTHAYFAQTAPYQQGARLTSLELQSLKIPSTMVLDTAMAALLSGNKKGTRIHAFIAGADRVAASGDTANKISTYQISLLCNTIPQPNVRDPSKSSYKVPVIICAPLTTLDLKMDDGSSIVIEERPEWEACTVKGKVWSPDSKKHVNGSGSGTGHEEPRVETVLITPEGTRAWNPAFDVTPAALIDGIVTEVGVAEKVAGAGEEGFGLRDWVKRKTGGA